MDCGIPYCHQGCPVNNIIPDWNDLVYKGDRKEASKVLLSTNKFPLQFTLPFSIAILRLAFTFPSVRILESPFNISG